MKQDELLKLIKGRESQEVEFKESCPSNKELAKIICAFANTDGGYLILGVNNKGEIVGLRDNLDRVQQDVSNARQSVSSSPLISTKKFEVEGKTLVVIEINQANDRNAHTLHGIVYVRIGSTIHPLDGQELFAFLKNKQILCFDEQESEMKIEDIDINTVDAYLKRRNTPDFLASHTLQDFLLSSMLAKANGTLKIKNVAALFFAADPYRWHPQSEVRVVRFAGVEPVQVMSQKDFKSDPMENIEQALSFIRDSISKRFIIPEHSPQRIEIGEYPMTVLREAVVNAVAHRDYFSYDAVQIGIFNDRIEISNPGGLPDGLTKEYFGKRSVRRNPLTYRLLRDCKYIEGLGTGVPRMINEMRKAGLRDPEFNFEGSFFIVTFRNATSDINPIEGMKDLSARQRNAIHYLKQNKTLKSKTYASINRISLPSAIKELNELITFGYVEKIGKFRGAYYRLK